MMGRFRFFVGALAVVLGVAAGLGRAPSVQAGSFPGPNGRIAFDIVTTERFDIISINPDGTGYVNLTDDEAGLNATEPNWSADGSRIAFVGATNDHPNGQVWTMNADGSNKVRHTSAFDRVYSPSFSPDGTKVVFAATNGPEGEYARLWILTLADDSYVQLTNSLEGVAPFDDEPVWSPTGNQIAYKRGGPYIPSEDAGLYIINADGTNNHAVYGQGAINPNAGFSWKPDGTKIAISDGEGVAIIDANGSGYHVIADGIRPSWSPDGTKIVFEFRDGGIPEFSLHVVNVDGSGDHRIYIDPNGEVAENASWGPNSPLPGTPPSSSTTSTTAPGSTPSSTAPPATTPSTVLSPAPGGGAQGVGAAVDGQAAKGSVKTLPATGASSRSLALAGASAVLLGLLLATTGRPARRALRVR